MLLTPPRATPSAVVGAAVGVSTLAAVAAAVGTGSPLLLSAGDLFGLAAMPFAVVMVSAVPRSGGDAVRPNRLLPLALLVGSAASLVVRGTVLLGDDTPSVGAVMAVGTVMAAVWTIAPAVAGAVIGRERAVAVLTTGALERGTSMAVDASGTGCSSLSPPTGCPSTSRGSTGR